VGTFWEKGGKRRFAKKEIKKPEKGSEKGIIYGTD
jgi:hypothetical protein